MIIQGLRPHLPYRPMLLTKPLTDNSDPLLRKYVWTYYNKTSGANEQVVQTGGYAQTVLVTEYEGYYNVTLGENNLEPSSDGNLITGVPYVKLNYPEATPTLHHIASELGDWCCTLELPFIGTVSFSKEGYVLTHDEIVQVSDVNLELIKDWAYDENIYLVPLTEGYFQVVLVLGDKMLSFKDKESDPRRNYNMALSAAMDSSGEFYKYSIKHDMSDPSNLLDAPHFPLKGLMVALGQQITYFKQVSKLTRSEMFKYLKYAKKWYQANLPPLQKQSNSDLKQLILQFFPEGLPKLLEVSYRDMQLVLKAYRQVKGGIGRLHLSCGRMLSMIKDIFGKNWESRYYDLVDAAKTYYNTVESAKVKLGYIFTD